MKRLSLLLMLLMTACAPAGIFNRAAGNFTTSALPVVTNPILPYSDAFKAKLAMELRMLDLDLDWKPPQKAPACAPDATAADIANSHCSAVRRALSDYHGQRVQDRAAP